MRKSLTANLPDDFIEKILAHARASKLGLPESIDEAVLAVLHRPLTVDEKWAVLAKAIINPPGARLNQKSG